MPPFMRNSITYFVHGRNVEIPAEFAHLVRMKRRDDIAQEYDISVRVLNRRIKEYKLQIPRKRFLCIEDVLEIYLTLKWPVKMRQNVAHTNSLMPNPSLL
ncbi:MAG: hypothetical protein OHK0019_22280 [Saprospiraceae bacterium]